MCACVNISPLLIRCSHNLPNPRLLRFIWFAYSTQYSVDGSSIRKHTKFSQLTLFSKWWRSASVPFLNAQICAGWNKTTVWLCLNSEYDQCEWIYDVTRWHRAISQNLHFIISFFLLLLLLLGLFSFFRSLVAYLLLFFNPIQSAIFNYIFLFAPFIKSPKTFLFYYFFVAIFSWFSFFVSVSLFFCLFIVIHRVFFVSFAFLFLLFCLAWFRVLQMNLQINLYFLIRIRIIYNKYSFFSRNFPSFFVSMCFVLCFELCFDFSVSSLLVN